MRKHIIKVFCDKCGKLTDKRYKLALCLAPAEYEGDERGDAVEWIAPNVFARDYCEKCRDEILAAMLSEVEKQEEAAVDPAEDSAEEPAEAQAAGEGFAKANNTPQEDVWGTIFHVIDNLRKERWAYEKIAELLTYKYDLTTTGDEVRRRYNAMAKASKAV